LDLHAAVKPSFYFLFCLPVWTYYKPSLRSLHRPAILFFSFQFPSPYESIIPRGRRICTPFRELAPQNFLGHRGANPVEDVYNGTMETMKILTISTALLVATYLALVIGLSLL